MVLAIIPARGGSEGIKRKNLVKLGGRPLIEYSIRAAQESQLIDEILLSTDDDEIAAVGEGLGLDVSYRRPRSLGKNDTAMIDVIVDGINWFSASRGENPETIVLLQPTSPLRSADDIDKAVTLLANPGVTSVVSVNEMVEHPSECVWQDGNLWEYLVAPPDDATRRQDYPNKYFFINGAVYAAETSSLLAARQFIQRRSTEFVVMPQERSVDIDTEFELVFAEAILKFAGNAIEVKAPTVSASLGTATR